MVQIASPLELFKAAMPGIGCRPPESMDDQSDEAVAARAIYEIMVADALGRHAFSFATKSGTLTYKGETGDYPRYAYAFPADVLLPRRVLYHGKPFRAFEIRGGQFLCDLQDSTDLKLIYNWRAPENSWPPAFTMGIIHKLTGHLASGLLDRPERGDALDRKGEGKLRQAIRIDRRAYPGTDPTPEPTLVKAWRGVSDQVRIVEATTHAEAS